MGNAIKYLFLFSIVLLAYGKSQASELEDSVRIDEVRFEELVSTTVDMIKIQINENRRILNSNSTDDPNYVIDIRHSTATPCSLPISNINDNLVAFHSSIQPKDLSYYVLIMNETFLAYFPEYRDSDNDFFQMLNNISNSEDLTVEKAQQLQQNLSQKILRRFTAEVSKRLSIDDSYVIVSVYNFMYQPSEGGGSYFELYGDDVFDVRFGDDFTDAFFDKASRAIPSYTREEVCERKNCLCSAIPTEVSSKVRILFELKNPRYSDYLTSLVNETNITTILQTIDALYSYQLEAIGVDLRLSLISKILKASGGETDDREAAILKLFQTLPIDKSYNISFISGLKQNNLLKDLVSGQYLFESDDADEKISLYNWLCKSNEASKGRDVLLGELKNVSTDFLISWSRNSFQPMDANVFGYHATDEWVYTFSFIDNGQLVINGHYTKFVAFDMFVTDDITEDKSITVDPFQIIGITFVTDPPLEIFPGAMKGKVYPIPAILLKCFFAKTLSNEFKQLLYQRLNYIGMAIGVSELVLAKNAIQYTLAIMEIAPAVTSSILDAPLVRQQIAGVGSDGVAFLAAWDQIRYISDAALITSSTVSIVRSFIVSFKNTKAVLRGTLSESDYIKIENEVNRIEQQLANEGIDVVTSILSTTFRVGDNISGITIKQIKQGSNGKYAIIGRSMGNTEVTGVRDVFIELRNNNIQVEIFDASSLTGNWKLRFDEAALEFSQKTNNWTTRLDNQQLMQLKMYQLNKDWAQYLIDEGYTILDMGDFNNLGFSVFYAMEKATIFR